MTLIGAHVSAAGGLSNAIENGKKIGAEVIQIFGASPRQYAATIPSESEVKTFLDAKEKSSIRDVYLHAAYLVNLASPEASTRAKSIKNLTAHFKIANLLHAEGLIFHIGSGKEAPKKEAIKNAVQGMKAVLNEVHGEAKLIMENAAGGGAKLGSTADDIQTLFEQINAKRLKVCFDTAHAFEAGIIEEYTEANINTLLNEWDKKVGLKEIIALHINDSKTAFNSKHDRHENIGEGYVGLQGFRNLAKEKRLQDKPWILEVPGFGKTGPDKRNIDLLRGCFA